MKKQIRIITLVAIALMMNISTNAQDTIFKLNNDEIISKIIEISSDVVKYKRQENLSGPVYTINKSEIVMIHYQNGMNDNFNQPNNYYTNTSLSENKTIYTSTHYVVTLNDGSRLKGRVISQNKTEVVILDNNIGEKKIMRATIKTMEPENGNAIRVITLNDGSIISGKILNQTDKYTIIETQDLGTINLPASKIKNIRDFEDATVSNKGSIWFKNPNSTRYLFAPSAFQLKKGEGYYQNIYGIGNSVQFGITNNVTLGGGLAGPFGAYIDTKLGVQVAKNVNIAGGILLGNSFFKIDDHNVGIGLGFGLVTLGNYDHNITLGAGYGIVDNKDKTDQMKKPVYNVNAMARVAKKFALVTENWMVNVTGNPFARKNISEIDEHYEVFYSYAFRYMGQKSTLDAGFVNTPSLFEQGWLVGIPYIGFVIRFGKYKDE